MRIHSGERFLLKKFTGICIFDGRNYVYDFRIPVGRMWIWSYILLMLMISIMNKILFKACDSTDKYPFQTRAHYTQLDCTLKEIKRNDRNETHSIASPNPVELLIHHKIIRGNENFMFAGIRIATIKFNQFLFDNNQPDIPWYIKTVGRSRGEWKLWIVVDVLVGCCVGAVQANAALKIWDAVFTIIRKKSGKLKIVTIEIMQIQKRQMKTGKIYTSEARNVRKMKSHLKNCFIFIKMYNV